MAEFHVPDMSCGHCKAAIEKALRSADPLAEIEVDLDRRRVRVAGRFSVEEALNIMNTAGYDAVAQG